MNQEGTLRSLFVMVSDNWVKNNSLRYRQHIRMGRRKDNGTQLRTILRAEPNACEICGCSDKRGLCCDHDHQTGKFRGWLCTSCNGRLGILETQFELNQRLLEYKIRETANNNGIVLTEEQYEALHYADCPLQKKSV